MRLFWYLVCMVYTSASIAQNRIAEYNSVGWYTTAGSIYFTPKWSMLAEYQWRRADLGLTWQQSLLRMGIGYQIHDDLNLRVGYAWVETYPYGDIPINSFGKQFTEHRTHQSLTTSHRSGSLEWNHRYMLEQRWLATYASAQSSESDSWTFVNRFRYMARIQRSLKGKTIDDKTPYAAAYNEIFIGFGQNVNQNIFDQNRLGILLGWRFSKQLRIEGGYFNQLLQLPRRVNNLNVIQHNEGIIVNLLWSVGQQ